MSVPLESPVGVSLDANSLSGNIAGSRSRIHAQDAVIDFLGGCAGGTASVYVGQPLDTVKVKMQTFPALYTNSLRCFMKTLRQDGIRRGLYAGTVPSLMAQVSENAVLFFAYGMCQKTVARLRNKTEVSQLSLAENALSGSCAGFFAAGVLCPTELIKCKLQAMREMAGNNTGKQTNRIGPYSLTREILRSEGLRGMFTGMVPTLAREMFGYCFFFGGYELCKTILTPPGHSKEELGAARTIICGGMGGIAFWTATFPADVIKSRVQIQGHSAANLSFFQMITHIARTEGVLALYNGLGPCLIRTFPATGALFLAYETTKKYLYRATYGKSEH